ncbi:MAG: hypothetical protein R3286_19355 [Gammaproteobacteria bacterium]|nr:hypothetical protein [Gammaproteobacteria bacterium]
MSRRILALLITLGAWLPAGAADLPYGVAVDPAELTTLFAYHSRGVDLDLGRNGPIDRAEAARWYQRSAVLGFPLSQYRLARHYEAGVGMTRDYVLAYLWYDLAAANGDPLAAADLVRLTARMSDEELGEARALATAGRRLLAPPSR